MDKKKTEECCILRLSFTSLFLGPNIFYSTLFSKAFKTGSFLEQQITTHNDTRHQTSNMYVQKIICHLFERVAEDIFENSLTYERGHNG
jgi:hypothetical protein